jgi:YD repeat-containing protein
MITVENPDGSQMTTYWNALNGRRIEKPYHLE